MGFFDKLKKINIFASFGSELTDDFYDELEESLILADTGMDVTLELVEALRRRVREERIKTMEEARSAMVQIIAEAMNTGGEMCIRDRCRCPGSPSAHRGSRVLPAGGR